MFITLVNPKDIVPKHFTKALGINPANKMLL